MTSTVTLTFGDAGENHTVPLAADAGEVAAAALVVSALRLVRRGEGGLHAFRMLERAVLLSPTPARVALMCDVLGRGMEMLGKLGKVGSGFSLDELKRMFQSLREIGHHVRISRL